METNTEFVVLFCQIFVVLVYLVFGFTFVFLGYLLWNRKKLIAQALQEQKKKHALNQVNS